MTPNRLNGGAAAGGRLGARLLRFALAYAAGWSAFLASDLYLGFAAESFVRGPLRWIVRAEVDGLVYLGLLLAAPVCWFLPAPWKPATRPAKRATDPRSARHARLRDGLLSLIPAGLAFFACAAVGRSFDDLPPAIHDEFAYVFQAKTFLAGRLAFPSHPLAPLFDQMHVLNEGQFASRYFPGAALWMAPFVAAGKPYLGHYAATALFCTLAFWIGRELAGTWAGLAAGLLCAACPGMLLFSNLLLAHQPTLVGLGLFLLGFLRLFRQPRWWWALMAGAGLAYALICRPATAVGVAAGFCLFGAAWAVRDPLSRRTRLRLLGVMGAPLLAVALATLAYNQRITGNPWQTPYALYTQTYTPRHVYGFNNAMRGAAAQGPRVIERYDRWALNLDARLAITNVRDRLIASLLWTLGVLPLVMGLVLGLCYFKRQSAGARLVLLSILALHAIHVPYWFDGIMHWHYVFESAPLWILWLASTGSLACREWNRHQRQFMTAWAIVFVLAACYLNFAVSSGVWSAPMRQGMAQVLYPRQKHAALASRVARLAPDEKVLVLVDADPANIHLDYVVNDPDLAGRVVMARYLPEKFPVAEIRRYFPDRGVLIYREEQDQLYRVQ